MIHTEPLLETIYGYGYKVLNEADVVKKAHYICNLSNDTIEHMALGEAFIPPKRPQRPPKPELVSPKKLPKRSYKNDQSFACLIHSLAHIECNAIDLALDSLCRFAPSHSEEKKFAQDFMKVARDEAKHFLALQDILEKYGYYYGFFVAHDGLWQASIDSAYSVIKRLIYVPLVLEARGLDVTPNMIAQCKKNGKNHEASILQMIHDDEINHVAVGYKWLIHECAGNSQKARLLFRHIVQTECPAKVKPPFNMHSRSVAGLSPVWYSHLY